MQDGTGTTSYSYEPGSGWLTEVKHPDQKRITYTYDTQGNRNKMTDPFGQVTEYRYDERNRLKHVGTNPAQWDATYAYKKNNQPATIQLLQGLTTTWNYETLKSSLSHVQAGRGTLHSYQYRYDIKGNQTGRTEDAQSYNFSYDKLSRIQTSSEYQENYTYDSRGNRQTLQSVKPLMLTDQSYTYDKKNRLTMASGSSGSPVSYKYNGDGLLTERTENGSTTRYYYDGTNIIAEGQVSGGVVTRKASYIRGNQLVARVDATGTKSYYMHNGHGDVVGLVNAAGQVLNTYSYDIWGNPVTTQEQVPQPFRYSGEYWDSSTGLQYLRARWYDPGIGRFINEDTYEGELTNPLSLNLYTYVHNNPLRYTDPSGNRPQYYKVGDMFRFAASSRFQDSANAAAGFLPLGQWLYEKYAEQFDIEPREEFRDETLKSALKITGNVATIADFVGGLIKNDDTAAKRAIKTIGKFAKIVDGALILGDYGFKIMETNDSYYLDIITDKLMTITSNDVTTLAHKTAYAKSRIKELIDEGKLTYETDFIDKIAQSIQSYNIKYDKKDLEQLKEELKSIYGGN
ncbi:RHS repeat-associated core domain-containing protein [Paenibacillus puerhi]|uniref:RHS repeat-associated core domain-containing protein n=1 Tax=Paenibacillus puerhi TaxID=2692622 RepID=UPI00135A31BA|nr:RHS repeat-associated core domain-containing protein [Paenibacillus puerhi]